jgi:hypothetical protein
MLKTITYYWPKLLLKVLDDALEEPYGYIAH